MKLPALALTHRLGPGFKLLIWATARRSFMLSGVPPSSDILGSVWASPGPGLPFSIFPLKPER